MCDVAIPLNCCDDYPQFHLIEQYDNLPVIYKILRRFQIRKVELPSYRKLAFPS
jgi:hypothetical protein